MGPHARLGAVLTVGLLILILNAYAVVNGHWDWSFDREPTTVVPDTAAEFPSSRLPDRAG